MNLAVTIRVLDLEDEEIGRRQLSCQAREADLARHRRDGEAAGGARERVRCRHILVHGFRRGAHLVGPGLVTGIAHLDGVQDDAGTGGTGGQRRHDRRAVSREHRAAGDEDDVLRTLQGTECLDEIAQVREQGVRSVASVPGHLLHLRLHQPDAGCQTRHMGALTVDDVLEGARPDADLRVGRVAARLLTRRDAFVNGPDRFVAADVERAERLVAIGSRREQHALPQRVPALVETDTARRLCRRPERDLVAGRQRVDELRRGRQHLLPLADRDVFAVDDDDEAARRRQHGRRLRRLAWQRCRRLAGRGQSPLALHESHGLDLARPAVNRQRKVVRLQRRGRCSAAIEHRHIHGDDVGAGAELRHLSRRRQHEDEDDGEGGEDPAWGQGLHNELPQAAAPV